MSADRSNEDKEEELEALLKRLVPSSLDVHLVSKLNREREFLETQRRQGPGFIQWARLVPLMLLCTMATFGFALLRFGDRMREEGAGNPPENPAIAMSPPVESADPAERFVPVSTHGTILKASSGGLVETESGPRQRLNIEYQDAYHWHDPESGTNIRLFRPRSEAIDVPLRTD